MARRLIVANPVLTLNERQPIIEDGAVIVSGNRIEAIGPASELRTRGPFDEELGGPDVLAMPGLWNGHFHSEAAFWPGVFDHIYELANIWVHEAVHATDEDLIYWSTLDLIARSVKAGAVGFLDFYYGRLGMSHFGAQATIQAFIDSGARAALGLASRDQSKYVHADDETFLNSLPGELADKIRGTVIGYAYPWEETAETFRTLANEHMDTANGRFRMMLAPDWTAATSDELYLANKALAREFGATLQTHCLETKYEMIYNVRNHGKTGAVRLADIGFLGPDTGVAHFVWATDDDIKAVVDSGAIIVHNPGSNLRLTSGVSPIRTALDAGARVGIGTDSISVSDVDDLFEEIRLAGLLQRSNAMYGIQSGRLPSFDLLHGAAHHTAVLGGFGDDLGVLAEGNRADLLLVDKTRIFIPGKFDHSDPHDVIVDRAVGADVRTSIIDGEVVLRDGSLTNVDEDQISEHRSEAAERMFVEPPQWLQDLRPTVVEVEPYVLDFFKDWDEVPIDSRYQVNTRLGPSDPEGHSSAGRTS